MRITIISTMEGAPWGGSEELWGSVAMKALKKGHQVQVCVKDWNPEPDKIKLLAKAGARIVKRKKIKPSNSLASRIKNKASSIFGSSNKNSSSVYLKEIKTFDPEVIFVSQGSSFEAFRHFAEITDLIQELKRPYFLLSQFEFETAQLLDASLGEKIKTLQFGWTKFYFVAKRNLQTVEKYLGTKIEHAEVISNVVNVEKWEKKKWPSASVLKMACIARYKCNIKGQDILIQALSDPALGKFDYQLDLYGSGPDKQYIQEMILRHKLEQKIKIADHSSDIEKVWDDHHMLVLPSLAEGTPLVLQECMLLGRPALTTDVGGCEELVIDKKTGLLCKKPEVEALKEKLSELFQMTMAQIKEMGDHAFDTARSKIDLRADELILADLEQVQKQS